MLFCYPTPTLQFVPICLPGDLFAHSFNIRESGLGRVSTREVVNEWNLQLNWTRSYSHTWRRQINNTVPVNIQRRISKICFMLLAIDSNIVDGHGRAKRRL